MFERGDETVAGFPRRLIRRCDLRISRPICGVARAKPRYNSAIQMNVRAADGRDD